MSTTPYPGDCRRVRDRLLPALDGIEAADISDVTYEAATKAVDQVIGEADHND